MVDLSAFFLTSTILSIVLLTFTTYYTLKIYIARKLNRPPKTERLIAAYRYALIGIFLNAAGFLYSLYLGDSVDKFLQLLGSIFFIYSVYSIRPAFRNK